MAETPAALRERVIEEYGLERLDLIDHPSIPALVVSMVRVHPSQRGEGRARGAMEEVIAWADANGRTLYLTPSPVGSRPDGMTRRKLEGFYRRLGFVKRPSGHGDFQVSEKMMREPKRITNLRRALTRL